MNKCVAFVVAVSALAVAQVAMAQTPTDSTAVAPQAVPVQAAPVQAAPAQTAPKPAASSEVPMSAGSYRYAAIVGGWLTPSGDFSDFAGSGWTVGVHGYQFINPQKMIAIGTDVGYQSFGKKNGVSYSVFPVDGILKIFFKPQTKKTRIFGQAGMGFDYTRAEVGNVSQTDYNFGTQAGGGMELHTNGPAALMFDATYHWVFATGTDPNFLSLRAGLMVPLQR